MSMPDRRIPGGAEPRLIRYHCPDHLDNYESAESSANVPLCNICGKRMIIEDPYAERRRRLREAE
jgi:hypothetical protein